MPDFVDLRTSAFTCRIGSNAACGEHQAGYNGVWSLNPTGMEESLFVPLYAGLNLEHYFDGWQIERALEPRRVPMTLERLDARSVRLAQDPTPFWGVESTTVFVVREPNVIEMEYRCVPRRPAFRSQTMGVFWASYIHAPEDKGIFFRSAGGASGGIVHFALPEFSSVRGRDDGVELDAREGGQDRIPPIGQRWERPWYYGRWRDWVYLVAFRGDEHVRFATVPTGAGARHPAWDFYLLVPDVEVDREYGLSVRCVVDRWQGEDWIEREAERLLTG